MVINGKALFVAAPIREMLSTKERAHGVSHGLTEVGYDIRVRQKIHFAPFDPWGNMHHRVDNGDWLRGHFTLASAMEEFKMPDYLTGIVHDKSTWARHGLSVFNTVIEPGWKGFLTLELIYHGQKDLIIPAGSGIAQVIFHEVTECRPYSGKYQNQEDRPIPPVME